MTRPTLPLYRRKMSPVSAERGVVLIVGLILLIVMSLLGLTSIKLATTDERLVAQSYDRGLAFQAAEAALREAEQLITDSGAPTPNPNTECSLQTNGKPKSIQICGVLTDVTTKPRWMDDSFTGWVNAAEVSIPTGSDTIMITPQYFVEYLGNDFPCEIVAKDLASPASSICKRYRVTAKVGDLVGNNKGNSGRASVMLQSLFSDSE
jgi:type IV pilus assembly protein PilX